MSGTTFRSQILFPCVIQSEAKNPGPFLPRPLLYGRGGRRAQPPVGEGSGPAQDADPHEMIVRLATSASKDQSGV